LTTSGLVRLSRGWAETRRAARDRKRRGGGSTLKPNRTDATTEDELRQRVTDDPKNRWIALDEIQAGQLRRGIMSSRLAVQMRDGTRVKLLWLKADPAFEILQALLVKRLGPNLRLR